MQYNLDLTPQHLFELYFNDGRSWESSAEITKQIWTAFAKRLSEDVSKKLQAEYGKRIDIQPEHRYTPSIVTKEIQMTKQVPALFTRTTRRVKQKSCTTLTQAQVQSLIALMKVNLNVEMQILHDMRRQASAYWNYCDPANPETKAYFNSLNYFKDVAKDQKTKIAKLNKLQNTLKKMR